MIRTLLDDCRPCLVALAIAGLLLVVVIRLSGARFSLRRLGRVHRCQRGGVQSLSFVLTLPVFVLIVMFIVQVSQLMIAQVVVNYAAYAAARSLSAWIPQHVIELESNAGTEVNGQNLIRANGIRPGVPFGYAYYGGNREDGALDSQLTAENVLKLDGAFESATSACASISPSRHLGLEITSDAQRRFNATWNTCQVFATENASASTRARLYNKFCYSYWNTEIWLTFENQNSQLGPSGNPFNNPARSYRTNEVGWEDPMTVMVRHNLALLPGPGRWLAKHLVTPGGPPDMGSQLIDRRAGPRRQIDGQSNGTGGPHDPLYNQRVFTTTIWARATVTNDGIKSLVPYWHTINVSQ